MKNINTALFDLYPMMDIDNKMVKNQDKILEVICNEYIADNEIEIKNIVKHKVSLNLDTFNDDFKVIQFKIDNMFLNDIIWKLYPKKYRKMILSYFPNLSQKAIKGVIFGIERILYSMRLDINPHYEYYKDDFNWYYQKIDDIFISKPYVYNSIKNYANGATRFSIFWYYLMATSHSTVGGIESVEFYDIKEINGIYKIVIPDTYITYDFFISKLIEINNKSNLTDGLKFIEYIFKNLCAVKCESEYIPQLDNMHTMRNLDIYYVELSKDCNGNVCFNGNYSVCTFKEIDFSNVTINASFVSCCFYDCNFTNVKWQNYYDCVPIIDCIFNHCYSLDMNDTSFLSAIKRCRFC